MVSHPLTAGQLASNGAAASATRIHHGRTKRDMARPLVKRARADSETGGATVIVAAMPTSTRTVDTEIIVVGAGVAGLGAAAALRARGRRCVVLEAAAR